MPFAYKSIHHPHLASIERKRWNTPIQRRICIIAAKPQHERTLEENFILALTIGDKDSLSQTVQTLTTILDDHDALSQCANDIIDQFEPHPDDYDCHLAADAERIRQTIKQCQLTEYGFFNALYDLVVEKEEYSVLSGISPALECARQMIDS